LVREHLAPVHRTAAGLRAGLATRRAFASTQAAWRFYANDRIDLADLARPLIAAARDGVRSECRHYALVVHDWSPLHYGAHEGKRDRVALSQSHDLGYELLTSLVVSDRHGDPLAAACQELRAADGVHTTRSRRRRAAPSQLDALAPILRHVDGLGLGRPTVHIIDREADSVAHYRAWHRRGRRFLVRADDGRLVRHEGAECLLPAVVERLRRRGAFQRARAVRYEGAAAQQWVAEAVVTLHRPARPHRRDGRPRGRIVGRPLRLRLVVSELRADDGTVRARWLLLTNLPAEVPAARVALWYYFRWRIESYFKLLKSAGMHLEQWQQETAAAVAKRLLVASMACAVVWQLERDRTEGAAEFRRWLVRLSGRQVGRGRAGTSPALLSGLWVLLRLQEVMAHPDLGELIRLMRAFLPPPP
jgi:hypothetical protein